MSILYPQLFVFDDVMLGDKVAHQAGGVSEMTYTFVCGVKLVMTEVEAVGVASCIIGIRICLGGSRPVAGFIFKCGISFISNSTIYSFIIYTLLSMR